MNRSVPLCIWMDESSLTYSHFRSLLSSRRMRLLAHDSSVVPHLSFWRRQKQERTRTLLLTSHHSPSTCSRRRTDRCVIRLSFICQFIYPSICPSLVLSELSHEVVHASDQLGHISSDVAGLKIRTRARSGRTIQKLVGK